MVIHIWSYSNELRPYSFKEFLGQLLVNLLPRISEKLVPNWEVDENSGYTALELATG